MPKSRRHLLLLEENADIRATFVALFECVYDFALHVATEARGAIGITGRQNVDVAVNIGEDTINSREIDDRWHPIEGGVEY